MTVSKKQELYAYHYYLSYNPVQAYVDVGYVSSLEQAKKSRNYTKPLHSKGVQ